MKQIKWGTQIPMIATPHPIEQYLGQGESSEPANKTGRNGKKIYYRHNHCPLAPAAMLKITKISSIICLVSMP